MTRYTNHTTLTAPRLAVLERLTRSEHHAVARNQIRWFVREGYLKRVSPASERPRYQLTAKALDVTAAGDRVVIVEPVNAGFTSDAVKVRVR